ncbi:kelch-like protein 3 isoform X1 [Ptychodera flava]|uniref:kelch-like protein 3 isoform X1 n=1 Tax=Ptychodera flava TaxID=63121 RepID=UPI003969E0D2
MWKNSEMCDVVLDIGTEQIPAHRVVLASLSPFFQTLFSTSVGVSSKRRQKTIKLQECEPLAAKVLVEFAYTRKLQVDSCNVQGLLSAASFLQLHKVKEACAAHLANELCPYNCIGISVFADFHDLGNLKRTADKMAIRHFPHVVEGGELMDAPFHSHLLPLLRRKSVTNAFPVQLFEAVLSWLERDMISREKHLREILKYLPIARIPPNYMKEVLLPNHRDVIQRRIVQNKIAKAKQTTNSPDEVGDNKPSTSKDFVQKTRTENDGDLEICKALDRVSDKDPCDSKRSKLSSEEDSDFQKVVSSPFGLIIPLVDGFDSSSSTSVCSFQFTECGKMYKRGTRSLDHKLFLNSIVQTANSLLSVGGIEQERYSFATYKAEKCVSKEYCFLVGPTCRDQGKRFVAIDIYSGKEDDLPRLKFARLDLGSALYNGRIYAVGGGMIHPDNSAESGSATDVDPSSVECFDLEGGASTWNIVHSMAHPRDSTRAAVIANRLFAVGGGISVVNKCTTPEQSKSETESDICFSFPSLKKFKRETESYNVSYTSLNVVEAYDHRTGQWTEMAPLQTARRGHGLVAYDERLYCAGGYDGNKCLDSVECYEPRMNRWYSVASLQTPRHGVALGVVNGTLYAVGGNSDYDKLISGDVDLTTCPLFEMYDPWLDSWKTVERFSDTSYASIFREQSCYCTSATSSFCNLRKKVTKTTSIGSRSVIVPRYSPRSWSSFRSVINPRKEIDF